MRQMMPSRPERKATSVAVLDEAASNHPRGGIRGCVKEMLVGVSLASL